MMTPDLQGKLLQLVKEKIPPGATLVDELATLLDLSTDSAYRRIRGDKPISLDETYKISLHYRISLDQLFNLQPEGFLFTGSFVQPESFRFDQWLHSVWKHVQFMNSFRERQLFYLCKDIPVFHHFHFREVAALKHFVWMKSVFNAPDYARKKFSLADYPDEIFEIGKKALSEYQAIDSVEIWNLESINSTMRQIDYYHDSSLFANEKEVLLIYEGLEKLLLHLHRQADSGYKFNSGEGNPSKQGKYQLYLNEMVIGDNSVLAVLDGSKMGFIVHTVMNVMATRDLKFCGNMYDSIQNLLKRSTLISAVSERERARFFRQLANRIARKKENA
jgi:hypothetical protein